MEEQFGGLAQLDSAMNNYKDNMKFLYHHADMILTIDRALRNIVICAYAHYIDTWAMNGACLGHHAILMHSMLTFAMHLGWHWCHECHFRKEYKRKKIPLSTPMLAIDVEALL